MLSHTSATTRTKPSVKGKNQLLTRAMGSWSPSHNSLYLSVHLQIFARKRKTTLNTIPDSSGKISLEFFPSVGAV